MENKTATIGISQDKGKTNHLDTSSVTIKKNGIEINPILLNKDSIKTNTSLSDFSKLSAPKLLENCKEPAFIEKLIEENGEQVVVIMKEKVIEIMKEKVSSKETILEGIFQKACGAFINSTNLEVQNECIKWILDSSKQEIINIISKLNYNQFRPLFKNTKGDELNIVNAEKVVKILEQAGKPSEIDNTKALKNYIQTIESLVNLKDHEVLKELAFFISTWDQNDIIKIQNIERILLNIFNNKLEIIVLTILKKNNLLFDALMKTHQGKLIIDKLFESNDGNIKEHFKYFIKSLSNKYFLLKGKNIYIRAVNLLDSIPPDLYSKTGKELYEFELFIKSKYYEGIEYIKLALPKKGK